MRGHYRPNYGSRTSIAEIVESRGGRMIGHDRAVIHCPCHHPDRTPSCSLLQKPDGMILCHCFAGCSSKDIALTLGIAGRRRPLRLPITSNELRAEEQATWRRRLWRSAQEIEPGDLVYRYLEGRGLGDVDRPCDLRLRPHCWFGNLKLDNWDHPETLYLPAMLSLLRNVEGFSVGVHRTYLLNNGTRLRDKQARRMMPGPRGSTNGAAVRLYPVDDDDHLLVTEGVETALACRILTEQRWPVWATLGSERMTKLVLPRHITRVCICADNDEPGRKAAEQLRRRFEADGRRVKICMPERVDTDWNDFLVDGTYGSREWRKFRVS